MLTSRQSYSLIRQLARQTWLVLIAIATATVSVASEQDLINAARGNAKKLNIYNWSDYINPDAITDFEKEYGINVTYDIYDSSEIVDTKLMTGRSGYDVVVHAASFTARLANAGIFHPVDFDKLPNWHHLDPDLVRTANEKYSNGLQGVPFFWGTTGITYNVDLIKARMPNAPLDSSALIFDPEIISKFTDCGISFLDDPTSVIPMGMMYLGYPANSVDLQQLKEVEALVKAVRPYITYFSSTKMLLDLHSDGLLCDELCFLSRTAIGPPPNVTLAWVSLHLTMGDSSPPRVHSDNHVTKHTGRRVVFASSKTNTREGTERIRRGRPLVPRSRRSALGLVFTTFPGADSFLSCAFKPLKVHKKQSG